MILNTSISYSPETDTMAIEVRPWPERARGNDNEIGGKLGSVPGFQSPVSRRLD